MRKKEKKNVSQPDVYGDVKSEKKLSKDFMVVDIITAHTEKII